jgi:hypothetical protein
VSRRFDAADAVSVVHLDIIGASPIGRCEPMRIHAVLTSPRDTYQRTVRPIRQARGRLGRYAVPAVLVAGWLAVALTHLRLPYPSDQLHYMEAAALFPHPIEGTELTHQMTRLGLTGPTRLAMTVFGYSQASYYFVPLLASLTLLLSTYAIGALMFSRAVGAGAAVIVLACTPIFYDATELLPDLFATALFTAAVALAVAVRRRRVRLDVPVLLVIGLLLVWSYLVREFIVFVWPLVPIVLWPRLGERPAGGETGEAGAAGSPERRGGRRWLDLLWLGLPIVVLVAAETATFWVVYGDPLARVKSVASHGEGPTPPEIARGFQNKPRWVYVARPWHVLGGTESIHFPERWILRFLLVAAIAGGFVWRWRRRLGLLLAWMALLWVPLALLGGVIDPSSPKLRLQLIRYWFPMFPAFVLAGVAVVWLLVGYGAVRVKRERSTGVIARVAAAGPAAAVAVLTGATVVLAGGGVFRDDEAWRGAREMAAFRSWMEHNGASARDVWTDGATRHVLKVFQQGPFGGQAWSARPRILQPGGAAAPAPGDIVVVFDAEQTGVCGACGKNIREALGSPVMPRPNWRQVFAGPEGVLRAYAVRSG